MSEKDVKFRLAAETDDFINAVESSFDEVVLCGRTGTTAFQQYRQAQETPKLQ